MILSCGLWEQMTMDKMSLSEVKNSSSLFVRGFGESRSSGGSGRSDYSRVELLTMKKRFVSVGLCWVCPLDSGTSHTGSTGFHKIVWLWKSLVCLITFISQIYLFSYLWDIKSSYEFISQIYLFSYLWDIKSSYEFISQIYLFLYLWDIKSSYEFISHVFLWLSG